MIPAFLMTSLIATTPIVTESKQEFYMLVRFIRKWESHRNQEEREPVEDMINRSLMELEYGSYDPTEQKVLLQLPSNGN